MKLLHTSDWHIGRMLLGFSLLSDQRYFIEQFFTLCKEERPDAILISGDLYNRAVPSAEAVILLDQALSTLVQGHSIPVLAIAGNHDSPQRLSFGASLLQEQGLYLSGVSTRTPSRVVLPAHPDTAFWLLPYFTLPEVRALFPEKTIESYSQGFSAFLEEIEPHLPSTSQNVLLAHGFFMPFSKEDYQTEFSGSELPVGSIDAIDCTKAAALFDYLALGHLHAPQKVLYPHVRYSGSPLKYSLSESMQKKSVTLVEINNNSVAIEQRTLPALRDVRVLEGAFEALLLGPPSEDYLFARLRESGGILYALERLRTVYPNLLGLSFSENLSQNRQLSATHLSERPMGELFSLFYEEVTDAPLSTEGQKLVEGILLEERLG